MGSQQHRVSERVAAIAESATLAVDAKAKALQAAGRPVIGFGAGEPDFPTPDYIVEAAQRACAEPRFHKYSPTAGLPELREAVAVKTARDSGLRASASQVLITNGGKQAVYQAFASLLDPGDEVLLPTPHWTTYPEAIVVAGGKPVPVLTDENSGYLTSVAQLEAHCTDRTKLLVFVSPSNPTGAVYPAETVAEIGRWAAARGIWVATDEIYEHLVYGTARFASMPVAAPELADRCVVLCGVAKPKTSNTNTLILNGVTFVNQGNATNSVGVTGRWFALDLPAGTNTGTLTITLSPASILTQPSGGIGFPGDSFSFSVSALGNGLNFQWQKSSNNIPDATNSILTLTNLALTDAGNYQVVINNPGGVTKSAIATLQVIQPVTNTIYLDHFSGASGALNGRTPDTATIASRTWIAAGGWTSDGTRANVPNSTINAFLPFTPVSGRLYRLSADINCVGSDSADWISLGFANGTNTGSAWQLVNNPVGWMLARDSGSTISANQTFLGPGQAGGSDTSVYPTSVMNYAILLDARPNNPRSWTFTFLVNSNVVEPATVFGGNGQVISSVGIGMMGKGGSGYVDNLTLTAKGSSAPFILLQPQGGSLD